MTDFADSLFLVVQIFFVDLLLGGDNAIVIAMACGRLTPDDTRRAITLGAVGAIALRLVMLVFANALLGVPLIKLIGAWTLIVIAFNVRAQNVGEAMGRGPQDFLSAAVVIMVADAAMSLDNVVALAAIADGNFWLMAIGVLISIPILVYGALILTRIIRSAPEVFTIGAAFLGWIAGSMATSDPLVAGWIGANAPALAVFAPALGALFVLAAGRGKAEPRLAVPVVRALSRPPTPPAPALTPALARVVAEPIALEVPAAAARPKATVAPARAPLAAAASRVDDEPSPGFAEREGAGAPRAGWNDERLVIAGFVLLAALAGAIIFVASLFDSLT